MAPRSLGHRGRRRCRHRTSGRLCPVQRIGLCPRQRHLSGPAGLPVPGLRRRGGDGRGFSLPGPPGRYPGNRPGEAKSWPVSHGPTPSWQRPPTKPGSWSSPMPCWLLNTHRALLKQERPLSFLPLPRQGRHGDTGLGATFASASALRQAMTDHPGDGKPYISYIVRKSPPVPAGPADLGGLYGLPPLRRFRRRPEPPAHAGPAAPPAGLYGRPGKPLVPRLRRSRRLRPGPEAHQDAALCLQPPVPHGPAYTLLQPSRRLMDQSYEAGPQYARLLALNGRGAAFLKGARDRLAVITKIRQDLSKLTPLGREQLALDLRASDVQSFCFSKENQRKGHQDYYHSPIFIGIQK